FSVAQKKVSGHKKTSQQKKTPKKMDGREDEEDQSHYYYPDDGVDIKREGGEDGLCSSPDSYDVDEIFPFGDDDYGTPDNISSYFELDEKNAMKVLEDESEDAYTSYKRMRHEEGNIISEDFSFSKAKQTKRGGGEGMFSCFQLNSSADSESAAAEYAHIWNGKGSITPTQLASSMMFRFETEELLKELRNKNASQYTDLISCGEYDQAISKMNANLDCIPSSQMVRMALKSIADHEPYNPNPLTGQTKMLNCSKAGEALRMLENLVSSSPSSSMKIFSYQNIREALETLDVGTALTLMRQYTSKYDRDTRRPLDPPIVSLLIGEAMNAGYLSTYMLLECVYSSECVYFMMDQSEDVTGHTETIMKLVLRNKLQEDDINEIGQKIAQAMTGACAKNAARNPTQNLMELLEESLDKLDEFYLGQEQQRGTIMFDRKSQIMKTVALCNNVIFTIMDCECISYFANLVLGALGEKNDFRLPARLLERQTATAQRDREKKGKRKLASSETS